MDNQDQSNEEEPVIDTTDQSRDESEDQSSPSQSSIKTKERSSSHSRAPSQRVNQQQHHAPHSPLKIRKLSPSSFVSSRISKMREQGKDRARNEVTKKGAQVASRGARQGARVGGRAAVQGGRLAAQGAARLAVVAVSNPVGATVAICIIIGLLLFFIIYFYFFSGGGAKGISPGNETSAPQDGSNPGPGSEPSSKINGFTLTLKGPFSISNGTEIEYEILYTYDAALATVPLENIVIYDIIPLNTTFVRASGASEYDSTLEAVLWKLSDSSNTSPLTITLRPDKEDTYIDNRIFARIEGGGASGGTACTAPFEGSGPCAVAELGKVFVGDPSRAIAASMICQQESTSNPIIPTNDTCVINGTDDGDDYSVGLFQINLIWHACPVANYAYEYSSPDRCAKLVSATDRSTCEVFYKDRDNNIAKAHELSSGGTNWNAWGAWSVVKPRLDNCGITVQ